jgi:hypothetical protein
VVSVTDPYGHILGFLDRIRVLYVLPSAVRGSVVVKAQREVAGSIPDEVNF